MTDIVGVGKYSRSQTDCSLSALLHSKVHWLDIPQQVQHTLAVTVHRCLRSLAPLYLIDDCIPILMLLVAGTCDLPATSN